MQANFRKKNETGGGARAVAVSGLACSQGFSEIKVMLGAFVAGGLLVALLTHWPWSSPVSQAPVNSTQTLLPSEAARIGRLDYVKDPAAGSRYMDTLARQSKGDFFRLNPQEQGFAQGLTGGYGKYAIRQRFKRLSAISEGQQPGIRKQDQSVRQANVADTLKRK